MADFITNMPIGADSIPERGRRVPLETMTTTAVRERSTMTIVQVKNSLSITVNTFDVEIGLALDAAKDSADRFLNNPFQLIDSAGDSTDTAIPPLVELGVLRLAGLLYTDSLVPSGGSGVGPDTPPGAQIASVKTGDLSVSYTHLSLDAKLEDIRSKYFVQYRFEAGFTHVRRF